MLAETTRALSSNTRTATSVSAAQLASSHGGLGGLGEQPDPVLLVEPDTLPQGARAPAELSSSSCEEAAAGKGPVLDVGHEGLAEGAETTEALGVEGWQDDDVDEVPASGVHRGELQFRLGPEVRIHAALADAGGVGELADAEPVESLDGGEPDRRVEDQLPRALTVLACAAHRTFRFVQHR